MKDINLRPLDDRVVVETILNGPHGGRMYLAMRGETTGRESVQSAASSLAWVLAFYLGPHRPRIRKMIQRTKLYREYRNKIDLCDAANVGVRTCRGRFQWDR